MKAWVLHDVDDFRYEEIDRPEIKADEVLVNVKACGICGSDIPRTYRDGAHHMPLVIGHEFAGEVVETGKSTDNKWTNKKVGIFPLIPCGKCGPCQKKLYEMCRSYSYLGSRRDGGFAEYVAVPEWNLLELPENVAYEEAAMLEPMAVAVHAMRRVDIQKNDRVVVCGLGTIGMLLLMFLLEAGVSDVLVIGNKDFQKENLTKLGISGENYCDSRFEDVSKWVLDKTEGNGADIFFECVGKNETVSQAVDLTAPAGQICLVGNPYSDMVLDKSVYWKILRNQLRVTGTWNSSFTHDDNDDWHYVLDRLKDKRVRPAEFISHSFSLEDIEKGFHVMRDKSEDYIKIMAKI